MDKICFTLDIYQKYREHFEVKKIVVGLESFTWGKEENLLLQKVDQETFKEFLDDFQGFLKKVTEKIPPPSQYHLKRQLPKKSRTLDS